MPNPKDPIKLQEYKEKQRRIALERGFGKCMKGRKRSLAAIEKQKATLQANLTEERRKEFSDRAKTNGYGKWMKGRPANPKFVEYAKSQKGKSYEERYGTEKGLIESNKRKEGNKRFWKKNPERRPPESFLKSGLIRTGKSYKEIYGERGEEESKKRSESHLKRYEGKDRPGCRDKKNGDHLYIIWRKAIFTRDNYTCQECKNQGGNLHAHHKKPWAEFPELRYDEDNGETLCVLCHSNRHPENKGLIASNQKDFNQLGKKDPIKYEK